MKERDEPVFDGMEPGGRGEPASPPVRERIRALAQGQPYGVLCVQGEGQPYGALVAFAFTPDLRHLVFATPRATRKFRLLSRSDRVALVVDNRPDKRGAFMEIEAVTLTGRARLVEGGEAWERWAALLLGRHPYLEAFVRAPTSALFRVETVRMLHVGRFQEVSQWVPEDPS